MIKTKEVITQISVDELKSMQEKLEKNILIIKFGAEWCGPCKKIKPVYDLWLQHSVSNIIVADIDIDDSLELYMALKTKKMVNGVPTLLAFYGDVNTKDPDFKWFIPSDSFSGGDTEGLKLFFNRCTTKAIQLQSQV